MPINVLLFNEYVAFFFPPSMTHRLSSAVSSHDIKQSG